MTDQIVPEQVDRDAAADILDEIASLTQNDGIGQVADLIRDGEYDDHDTVQRVARHRLAAFNAGLERAAGIAESKRGKGENWMPTWPLDGAEIATAIRAAKEPSK